MTTETETKNKQKLSQKIKQTTSLGLLLVVLGSIAILQPLFTTLTTELLFEEIFLAAGIVRLLYAFNTRQSKKFKLKLILGLIYIIAGLLIVADYYWEGQINTSFFLAIAIFINGVIEIFLAIQVRRFAFQWGWILLSGITAIISSILIISSGNYVWVIGILVGINVLATGLWLTVVSRATHSALKKL